MRTHLDEARQRRCYALMSDKGDDDSDGEVRILSRQGGGHVTCHDNNIVYKYGDRVRHSEEVAMRLVKQHTGVPVPKIILSSYEPETGNIGMSFIPGIHPPVSMGRA